MYPWFLVGDSSTTLSRGIWKRGFVLQPGSFFHLGPNNCSNIQRKIWCPDTIHFFINSSIFELLWIHLIQRQQHFHSSRILLWVIPILFLYWEMHSLCCCNEIICHAAIAFCVSLIFFTNTHFYDVQVLFLMLRNESLVYNFHSLLLFQVVSMGTVNMTPLF